jgi:hypothetical protein
MKLSGILYLYDISQARLGTTFNNMEMFYGLCGDDTLRAVVLMTTKWDAVDVEVGIKREEQLSSEFWKPMLERGSTICRFHHTPASAQAVLDSICNNFTKHEISRPTTRSQPEVVNVEKRIPDALAGERLIKTGWRNEVKLEDPILKDGRPTDIVIP